MSRSPAPVDEFHWLNRQRRGNDVVSVVPPPAHHDEPVHLAGDEDEAAGADEAQQAGPHEGVLADQPPAGAHRVNLQTHRRSDEGVAMATDWRQSCMMEPESDITVFLTQDFYIGDVVLLVLITVLLWPSWVCRGIHCSEKCLC